MRVCKTFFCLFCIPTVHLAARKQSFRPNLVRPLSRRTAKAIEVFMLLLALAFLPITRAWAQTYPVTDSFSGTGALSGNWTNTNPIWEMFVPLEQNGGTANPSVGAEQGLAIYSGAAFTSDQYAQARFTTFSNSDDTAVCVRMDGTGDGICYAPNVGLMWRLVNGAWAYTLSADCPNAANGDTIKIQVVGGTYTCIDVTTGVSASAVDTTSSLVSRVFWLTKDTGPAPP